MTNSPSLKRTHTLVSSSPSDSQETNPPSKVPALAVQHRMSLSLKRRYPFCKPQSGPASGGDSSGSAVAAAVASILDTEMSGCSPVVESSRFAPPPPLLAAQQLAPPPVMTSLHHSVHKSHSSVSTSSTSSSSNSSPTTTISTVESIPSEEQATPGSSPDSPDSLMALPSFRSRGRVANDLSIVPPPPSPGPGSGRPQSPSKKPRNTKNLSLNVPPSPAMPQLATGVVVVPDDGDRSKQSSAKSISAPSSPAFIMPPPPQNPRRRPSHLGLTIKLPGTLGADKPLRHHQSSPSLFSPGPRLGPGPRAGPAAAGGLGAAGGGGKGMVFPQSANFCQTTFQFQRPSVFNNHNRWASENASSGPSSAESNSPPKSPEILHEMDEEDDADAAVGGDRRDNTDNNHGDDDNEPPRSGEAKSPAYPAGPSLIFEPNIYLYAEPNAELASQFDVVINVAREVVNPFKAAATAAAAAAAAATPTPASTPASTSASASAAATNNYSPVLPDTACTESSFKTAFEDVMSSPFPAATTPTTPKNSTSNPTRGGTETPKPPQSQYREPEYIHMPWDHNTPILDDLPALVDLIDKRSSEGKKVLVHCQCGVSRSATLLIAFSMFKNPDKSMQDAYSAVKAKSRWIGPNMSLIYQLTDWKKMITTEAPKASFGGWRGAAAPATAGLRTTMKMSGTGGSVRGRGAAGMGMDCGGGSDALQEPQTAPLPDRRTSPSGSPVLSPMELKRSESHKPPQLVRTRSANGGFIKAVSPGPSSAPPGMVSIPSSTTSTHNRQSWPEGDEKLHLPPPTPRVAESPRRLEPLQQQDVWTSPRGGVYEPPEPSRPPPPPPMHHQHHQHHQHHHHNPQTTSYSIEKSGLRMPGAFEHDDDSLPPPTPSLASPRNSGFWATVPSRRMSAWGTAIFPDPRSPTERGSSTQVIRNIFDVL